SASTQAARLAAWCLRTSPAWSTTSSPRTPQATSGGFMTDTEQIAADHHMRVDHVLSTPKNVLIVVANPSTSTTMGWPVGLWGAGKTLTGFANGEQEFSDGFVGPKVMAWRVADVLKERGANYIDGGLFKAFAVRDGRLIPGQQQYSGRKVAQKVIEALGV